MSTQRGRSAYEANLPLISVHEAAANCPAPAVEITVRFGSAWRRNGMKSVRPAADLAIVDSREWLQRRVTDLLAHSKLEEARAYLRRLLQVTTEPEARIFVLGQFGLVALRCDDVVEARQHFREAVELRPFDPGLIGALAHCEARQRSWWTALVCYFEAIHHSTQLDQIADCMRGAGESLRQLGYPREALSMLLGALERAPTNPWVLDELHKLYESTGRLFDALDVADLLSELLEDAARSEANMTPTLEALWRHHSLANRELSKAEIRERTRLIRKRLREAIGPVAQDHSAAQEVRADLFPLNLPTGLHTLVFELSKHSRCRPLLETAQELWARAHHDRFDIHLSPPTLAAALQWITERLHWRIPSPAEHLATQYEVDVERVRGAVRLVVGPIRYRVCTHALAAVTREPRHS